MKAFLLALALLLGGSAARADFTYNFDADYSHAEGLAGLHLGRSAGDPFTIGIAFDYDGMFAWDLGLDYTLDYSYAGVTPTPPDLVLAYSRLLHADNLRLRADDARLALGPSVGHPVMPFQLQVTAGRPGLPDVGGIAVGTRGYQYGLYLYNQGGSKRTTISFQNLFGFSTDSLSNGVGDFRLYNWQSGGNVFSVTPANGLVFSASTLGFFAAPPTAKPTVSGSWTDGTAPRSLLAALVLLGLVTDGTTP